MPLSLSQIGIETAYTVEAWHVSQSIDAFTGAEAYAIVLSGSLDVTGPTTITGPTTVNGTTSVYGNLYVDGTASVNYLQVTYESASILYTSGSTKFGNSLDDTHTFTGSIFIDGLTSSSQSDVLTFDSTTGQVFYTSSLSFVSQIINNNTSSLNITGSLFGTASYAETASYVDLVAGPYITINQVGTSFEITGSGADTGSLYYSSSVSANTITFYQGDGTTEDVTLNSGGILTWYSTSLAFNDIAPGSYGILVSLNGAGNVAFNLPHVSSSVLGDVVEIHQTSSHTGDIIVNAPSTGRIGVSTTSTFVSNVGGDMTVDGSSGVANAFRLVYNGNSYWRLTQYSNETIFGGTQAGANRYTFN